MGMGHQKKMLAIETEHNDKVRRGFDPTKKMPWVKPIPYPGGFGQIKTSPGRRHELRRLDDLMTHSSSIMFK